MYKYIFIKLINKNNFEILAFLFQMKKRKVKTIEFGISFF